MVDKEIELNDAEEQMEKMENHIEKSKQYWNHPDTTDLIHWIINKNAHEEDTKYTLKLLEEIMLTHPMGRALDLAAGIGRVTKYMLSKYYQIIDLVELADNLLNEAKKDPIILKCVGKFYCTSIQQFEYEYQYDCIAIYYVLGHLKETECMIALSKAKKNLNPNGVIILKDNISENACLHAEWVYIKRTKEKISEMVEVAGFKIILNYVEVMEGFEDGVTLLAI